MQNREHVPATVRCYVKKEGHQWVAVCIDLSLAAQADSLLQARMKLESMINTYVAEALGPHRDYAPQLLSRKAPLSQRLTYYALKIMLAIHCCNPAPWFPASVFSESPQLKSA